ncbi:hypothetical protein VTK26DRAFT_7145 [Humicola hyalothermophila]
MVPHEKGKGVLDLYLYSLYYRPTSGPCYLRTWWIDAFGSWPEPRARTYLGWRPPGEPALRLLAIHPCSDGLNRPETLLRGPTPARGSKPSFFGWQRMLNPGPPAEPCCSRLCKPTRYLVQTPLCHLPLGCWPTCSRREPHHVLLEGLTRTCQFRFPTLHDQREHLVGLCCLVEAGTLGPAGMWSVTSRKRACGGRRLLDPPGACRVACVPLTHDLTPTVGPFLDAFFGSLKLRSFLTWSTSWLSYSRLPALHT